MEQLKHLTGLKINVFYFLFILKQLARNYEESIDWCVKQTSSKFIDYLVSSPDQQQQQHDDDFFQTKMFCVQCFFCRARAEKNAYEFCSLR